MHQLEYLEAGRFLRGQQVRFWKEVGKRRVSLVSAGCAPPSSEVTRKACRDAKKNYEVRFLCGVIEDGRRGCNG